MTGTIIIAVVGVVCMLLLLALYMRMRSIDELRKSTADALERSRSETQQKLDTIQGQLLSQANSSSATLQKQFSESARIIGEVSTRLADLTKTNTQILDFSRQLQSLENILKNPKQRGVLGEYFLEDLLGNVFQPNQYRMQYTFENGEKVDAVVFYKDKIIPIDAKFSLENYNRMMVTQDTPARELAEKEFKSDVKKRIDESAKYVRPRENTTDFVFMFVPAEGVYYNLLVYNVGASVNTRDLIEYAFSKKVIIVSPTSFYAYLQTVLMGIRAQKVEDNVKDIVKRVHDLETHLRTFDQHMQKLGSGLSTAVGTYNIAYKEFGKIDKDIMRITDKEAGGSIDPVLIDKPSTD